MTISQALQFAIEKLTSAGIRSAVLDSEILLSDVLNMPIGKLLPPLTPPLVRRGKAFLYSHPEIELNKKQKKLFKKYIAQRAKHEPAAYIIHKKEFYGLEFFVNKHVLIPRPETETLVEKVLKIGANKKILEIGTGSGCISITLVKNITGKFLATDISRKALKIAKKNAKRYKLQNKIQFIKSDLLKNKKVRNFNPNIIIANLPYLPKKYKQQVEKNIFYEPQKALWAGKDGLKYYKKLFQQISKLKNKPCYIFIEIDPSQKKKIKKYLKNLKPIEIKFIKNLNGTNRVAKIRLN